MTITHDQMLQQGFIFNDEGEGFSEQLKDKWHPEEKLMSTGYYFLSEDKIFFDYANSDGVIFEREDFPE